VDRVCDRGSFKRSKEIFQSVDDVTAKAYQAVYIIAKVQSPTIRVQKSSAAIPRGVNVRKVEMNAEMPSKMNSPPW
jgi:pyruvate kinase